MTVPRKQYLMWIGMITDPFNKVSICTTLIDALTPQSRTNHIKRRLTGFNEYYQAVGNVFGDCYPQEALVPPLTSCHHPPLRQKMRKVTEN